MVQRVMMEAASAASHQALDQLMRFHGRELVNALTELAQSGQAQASAEAGGLEARLRERGVRQNILDNLEISRLHFRRGLLIFEHVIRNLDRHQGSDEVNSRIHACVQAQWEHFFGLTFLSFIAAGRISEDAPGVDLMLPWMRSSSRQVYVHAAAADEDVQTAA